MNTNSHSNPPKPMASFRMQQYARMVAVATTMVLVPLLQQNRHDNFANGFIPSSSCTKHHQRRWDSAVTVISNQGSSRQHVKPDDVETPSILALYMAAADDDETDDENGSATKEKGFELPQSILIDQQQEQNERREESMPALQVPRPPDESPKLALLTKEYDALKDQSDQTAFVIEELSTRTRTLQEQLQMKQQELTLSRKEWGYEKNSFLQKIAEMTGIIEQNEVINEEERYKQQKLQSEVKLLQEQIVQTNMALKREQKASEELRKRLDDVNDAMEFEQMNFEKERKALQEKLRKEKQRLRDVQAQWDQDKDRFESAKGVVQQQLDEERDRLKKAQLAWAENQFEYEEQQESLRQLLEQQKSKLAETQALLESERVQFGEERSALKSIIEADRLKLQDIEQLLEEEQTSFRSAQADLEKQILDEQDKVDALYTRLAEEQERFYKEKDNLEVSLDLERKRVESVEKDLAKEKKDFELEKAKLQAEIDEQVRINRLKKKQMANRYEAIRTQLTGLWEGAKQDARKERKELTAKYEGKLSAMSQKVAELEKNLFNARKSNEELATVLNDIKSQKAKAKEETQNVESRYITMLSQRNREIAELKTGINDLKDTVAQREAQLQKYESSFRELVKLGLKVTGTKVKKSRSRLSSWFRRGDDV